MMKIGLIGYGKAGKAVARVLAGDPGVELCWIMRRTSQPDAHMDDVPQIPIAGLNELDVAAWLDAYPVDAIVDFSQADSVHAYGEALRQRQIMLVSAISNYADSDLDYLRTLGEDTRVMCSPNITLGINFLMMAAKLLRGIAPFADVEVIEQHFKEKPEISGTARKIAQSLNLEGDRITSLRVGGIVGHHEVIFGFPHQTVRLVHESIRREAFGTGALFAVQALAECDKGFYTFDDVLMTRIRAQLLAQTADQAST